MDTRPKFPLSFVFKIHTPSNDFSVYGAHGRETAYTRQKMFRLAEQIEVFRNSMRDSLLYRISAGRIIDFNACYRIMSVEGEGGIEIGSVRRKGIRSLWRISYRIYGGDGTLLYSVSERNPWTAVLDSLFSVIPFAGWLSGYVFNPAYIVRDTEGNECYLLQKEKSLLERRFTLKKTARGEHDELVTAALMVLMLLDRTNA